MCVRAPQRSGGIPGVCRDASGDCEDGRGTAGGPWRLWGVPTAARGGSWPAPPQGRPQRVAGRAEAAGRGGARGPAGRAAGLCGPRGAGGAVPQRPPRLGRPAAPPPAPRAEVMARPRGLGRIPELQLEAFPAAAAAATEDEAFLPEPPAPRAPRRPRSPPSSPVFFASPSPTFHRRLRLLRGFQDFGRQAWAG